MTIADLTAADLSTMTAQEYALLSNAERNAQARAEGWTCWTLHPADDAFWAQQAENGVVTAADLIRRDTISTHSDLYKEIHNIRPRWVRYDSLSTEEIEEMVTSLFAERRAEEAAQAEALLAEQEAEKAAFDTTPLTYNPFSVLAD